MSLRRPRTHIHKGGQLVGGERGAGKGTYSINQSINQSIFNLNSHKHFYSVEKKNRIHLNIIYNLHIEDDK